jgi:clan AA aspartic protease (TIGR02281 family)
LAKRSLATSLREIQWMETRTAAATSGLPKAVVPVGVENRDRVKMVESGGIYHVPVVINGALKLDFIVDSGASYVSIPADVVRTLIRTGTIKKSDFTGTETYSLADGSAVESGTFIIRSLRVGDRTVTDVRASIADVDGPLLLGQSFLKKFKAWSQDNAAHELILE